MPNLPTLQPWRIVGITYEQTPAGWLPVVRHEFYGPTPQAAAHVRTRHLETDQFLAQCESGHFEGVVCRTFWYEPEKVM